MPIMTIAVIVFFIAASAVKVLAEYERGVVFFLGRLLGPRGPGLVFVIPGLERMVKIDTRTITMDVPSQDVITRDNVILATGYNGSITRQPHCDEVGCMMENDHCVRTIHAEVNAITNAAKMGTSVNGGTMYCTGFPCWPCFKVVANAGIKTVYVTDYYRINEVIWRPAYDLGIVFYIPVGSDPDGITIFKEVDSLDFKCRRKS